MGGRAAEEVIFDEITTGAANDFDQATQVAKAMVVEYGMRDLGPINFGPTRDLSEWGKMYVEQNTVSQEVLAKIDDEVKKIITVAYEKAKITIQEKRELLDKTAQELVRTESLDQDEFESIVGKKQPKN